MVYSTTIQILNSLTISTSFQLQLHSCIKISQQGKKPTKTFLETKKENCTDSTIYNQTYIYIRSPVLLFAVMVYFND